MRALLSVVFVGWCAVATPLRGQRSPSSDAATKVGPARGTVIVVGGGFVAPDLFDRFIEAAGGPDALIVVVPTATGDTAITQDAPVRALGG
jgi:cyanophycinase